MKALEISEEQKEHLLEMAKYYFPEYNTNESTGYGGLYFGKKELHGMIIGYLHDDFNDSYDDPDLYIHWFEFVMTHLVERVLNTHPENPSRGLIDKFKEFFWKVNCYWMYINEYQGTKEPHPIDYLYNIYKEQKNSFGDKICTDDSCYCGKYKKGDLMKNCDGGCMYPGA